MISTEIHLPETIDQALERVIFEDATLRKKASTAAFEHADPVTEAEILVQRGRLLIDLYMGIQARTITDAEPALIIELIPFVEQVARSLPTVISERTEVKMGDIKRRVILPRDSASLDDALSPRVTSMGLPAATPNMRGNLFELLQRKHSHQKPSR